MQADVIALVRDLIFASRIRAAAAGLGVPVLVIRETAQLEGQAGKLLLGDLNQAQSIEASVKWKQRTQGQVIGFVSHVDSATINAARAAGIDRVMARSGFVDALDDILRTHMTGNSG